MHDLIMVICWLGVLQSFLLCGYFLTTIDGIANRLFLGLALLLVGIRATKSTLFVFAPAEPSVFLINAGFAAHAATGPMLLLYVKSLTRDFTWRRALWLHFVPAFSVVAFSLTLTLNGFWYKGGYSVLLFYTLVYMFLFWRSFLLIARADGGEKLRGIGALLCVLSIFLLAYFGNYVLRVSDYVAGPVVYSTLIFGITFLAIRNNTIFTQSFGKKYQNLKLSEEKATLYHQRIIDALQNQRSFLKSDFSLQQLAKESGVPVYEMSFILNEKLGTNFTSLTNSYRIAEAKKILADPQKNHLSIAGIAFDSGFNSLSSFNNAFKKLNSITPSEFRKRIHS